MKQKISELVDGELGPREFEQVLAGMRCEGEARDAWRTYHLISDAMRDSRLLAPGFSTRVAARLAQEPPVRARLRPVVQALAAGLAALVMVGALWSQWPAEAPAPAVPPLAQAPAPRPAPAVEPPRVAPPAAAHDYLLAHERYSPRASLQGMAAYVRTVSDDLGARRP